jgi:hypothetical protein
MELGVGLIVPPFVVIRIVFVAEAEMTFAVLPDAIIIPPSPVVTPPPEELIVIELAAAVPLTAVAPIAIAFAPAEVAALRPITTLFDPTNVVPRPIWILSDAAAHADPS